MIEELEASLERSRSVAVGYKTRSVKAEAKLAAAEKVIVLIKVWAEDVWGLEHSPRALIEALDEYSKAQTKQLPKRRFQVTVDMDADSTQEIRRMFQSIAVDFVEQEAQIGSRTSVGGDGTYRINIEENPDQTHEKYHEELNAYLKSIGEFSNG